MRKEFGQQNAAKKKTERHLFNLFVYSRHEVHSMNTHTLQRRLIKQTIQNVVQDIEAGEITGLQTLFATALKTEP